MPQDSVFEDLQQIARDLHADGYNDMLGGKYYEKWIHAWAEVMRRVASGQKYDDGMAFRVLQELYPD